MTIRALTILWPTNSITNNTWVKLRISFVINVITIRIMLERLKESCMQKHLSKGRYVIIMSRTRFIVNLYSAVAECQGTICSKQARYLKFKWEQQDPNSQLLSLSTNTQPFSQTGHKLTVCCCHITYSFQIESTIYALFRARSSQGSYRVTC